MREYRVFTNDRGKQGGVPMYSALCLTKAETAKEAAAKFPHLGPPKYARVVAIEWPVETEESNEWLEKHVNGKQAEAGR